MRNKWAATVTIKEHWMISFPLLEGKVPVHQAPLADKVSNEEQKQPGNLATVLHACGKISLPSHLIYLANHFQYYLSCLCTKKGHTRGFLWENSALPISQRSQELMRLQLAAVLPSNSPLAYGRKGAGRRGFDQMTLSFCFGGITSG